MKAMRSHKARSASDELRPEYDIAALGRGVRGKYFKRATSGSNVVVLEPEIANAFPTDQSVNSALRALLEATTHVAKRSRKRRG